MRRNGSTALAIGAVLASSVLAFAACGDVVEPPGNPATHDSVKVLAGQVTVFPGDSTQLLVAASGDVEWTSRNPVVATVSASGRVTGRGLGATHVVAALKSRPGVRDSVLVDVPIVDECFGLMVVPSQITLAAGDSVRLSWSQCGSPQPPVHVRSNAPEVALVTATGWVAARAPGTAVLTLYLQADTTVKASVGVRVQ